VSAPTRGQIRAIIFGLMIMLGLGVLDQSIVSTALPRIVSDLGGIAQLTWVVTAYILTSTAVMPLYGKASDEYGRKPMVYVAILTFLAGSALCGAAQNLTQLILFRALQGLGAGGLAPLTQTIIGDLVPPSRRGRSQGMIAAVFAVCSVARRAGRRGRLRGNIRSPIARGGGQPVSRCLSPCHRADLRGGSLRCGHGAGGSALPARITLAPA